MNYKVDTFMTAVQIKNKTLSALQKSPKCFFLFINPPLYSEVTTSLTFIITISLLFFIAYYLCSPKQWSLIISIFELHINGSLLCIFFYVLLFYLALYICENHSCCCTELNSFIFNYLVFRLNKNITLFMLLL